MSTLAVSELAPRDASVKKIVWDALGDAETGAAAGFPEYVDRSIHVSGTFGGATVTIEGSNDGVNFSALNDAQGVALTFTVEKVRAVLEVINYIRPVTSGGTGSDIDVSLVARRPNFLRT